MTERSSRSSLTWTATRRSGLWYQWGLIVRSYARNRTAVVGLAILVVFVFLTVAAPWILSQDPNFIVYDAVLKAPSAQHLFGTDQMGRDQLARVVYGARVSLQVGMSSVAAAAVVGVLAGLAAGFYRGRVDAVTMRIVDAIMSLPSLLLAIFLVGALGPSLRNALMAIAITFMPAFARVTRASTLAVREMPYIEAARAIGATNWRVMFRGVLPNVMSTVIVQLSLAMSRAILTEAGLSFLGLGVQPPTPAWGSMLGEGRNYVTVAWWLTTFPGLAIFFTVLAFNFIGDGLSEALNPKLRRI